MQLFEPEGLVKHIVVALEEWHSQKRDRSRCSASMLTIATKAIREIKLLHYHRHRYKTRHEKKFSFQLLGKCARHSKTLLLTGGASALEGDQSLKPIFASNSSSASDDAVI